MALPCSRRPAEVDEELQEELQSGYKLSIKLKLNTLDIFMATMASWYQNEVKPGEELPRKKQVTAQGRRVCQNLRINYKALPSTWLKDLHDEQGLNFGYECPTVKARNKALRALVKATIRKNITVTEMRRKMSLLKLGGVSSAAILEELRSTELKEAKPTSSKYLFHDLTNEPPPAFWVEAYATGLLLPRTLKIATSDDTKAIVAYYDYGHSQFVPTGFESMCHEWNHFLSVGVSRSGA